MRKTNLKLIPFAKKKKKSRKYKQELEEMADLLRAVLRVMHGQQAEIDMLRAEILNPPNNQIWENKEFWGPFDKKEDT